MHKKVSLISPFPNQQVDSSSRNDNKKMGEICYTRFMSGYDGRKYYVYILTSDNNILYVGMTGHLEGRMYQHQFELVEGFTKRYHIHHLIYYEEYEYVYDAINREKQIKRWSRKKKLDLVRRVNPKFEKLNAGWFDEFEDLIH